MQATYVTLDPNVHGGVFLAENSNDWASAVATMHKGPSRPSYAVAGMHWVKEVSGTTWELYIFDGADDIKIGTINISANTFTPAGLTSGVEPGTVVSYAGSAAPTGWLLCNGQAVSRSTYSALWTAISTTYGAGDGSTTFNVPDLCGRVVAGLDNMGGITPKGRLTSAQMSPDGNTRGAVGGGQSVTLTSGNMPIHNHGIPASTSATSFGTAQRVGRIANAATNNFPSQDAGSGDPHPNLQPTIMLNYIIKT